MHLAGDIGGTKTALALFDRTHGPHHPMAQRTLPSRPYASFADLARDYIGSVQQPVTQATLGVPGPVIEGHVSGTNLPWDMDETSLAQELGLERVRLINDLYALAQAIPTLDSADLVTLNEGQPGQNEPMAVVAPGTGLGTAYLTWDGERYRPQASEAGHADWAPNSAQQARLYSYLAERFGHVSNERVCSGTGIPNLYAFLRDVEDLAEPPELRALLAGAADPVPVIVEAALKAQDAPPICRATLGLFVEILAEVAGNMALAVLARGGVFLGGGIPPKILPALQTPDFVAAFGRKGRLAYLMQEIPVHVIVHPYAGLLGAAAFGLASA